MASIKVIGTLKVRHTAAKIEMDDVDLVIHACLNENNQPDLSVRGFQHGDEDGNQFFMKIMGYDDIDLLRRYCEMTLELFDKGKLD